MPVGRVGDSSSTTMRRLPCGQLYGSPRRPGAWWPFSHSPWPTRGRRCQAATPDGLTVPAQVSASNWTVMPNRRRRAPRLGLRRLVRDLRLLHGRRQANANDRRDHAEMWNGRPGQRCRCRPCRFDGPYSDRVSCVTTGFCVAVGFADYRRRPTPRSSSSGTDVVERRPGRPPSRPTATSGACPARA